MSLCPDNNTFELNDVDICAVNITLIYVEIAEIFVFLQKLGLEKHAVDVRF